MTPTLVRRTAAVVLAAAAAAGCGSAAGHRTDSAPPTRHYLLVSGRDDHGLLELATVPLAAHPGAAESTHDHAAHEHSPSVADGTVVRVLEIRGDWHLVETLTATPVRGWIDDYRLRGTARLVAASPRCTVQVGATAVPNGEPVELLGGSAAGIDVRLERDPAVRAVVPAALVREVPPMAAERCSQS